MAPFAEDNYRIPEWPPPFVGREEEIESLLAWANRSHALTVVIEGPAGIGKTRLAAQFAFMMQSMGWSVFWLQNIVDDSSELDAALAEARKLTQAGSRVLVVADDVTSRRRAWMLAKVPSNVKVLITSRDPWIVPASESLVLGAMTEADSQRFLDKVHGEIAPEDRRLLVARAGGNPAVLGKLADALVRAGGSIGASRMIELLEDYSGSGAQSSAISTTRHRAAQLARGDLQHGVEEMGRGRFDVAVTILTTAVAALAGALGPTNAGTVSAATILGRALLKDGKAAEAVGLLREALNRSGETQSSSSPQLVAAQLDLVAALRETGQYEAANSTLSQLLVVLQGSRKRGDSDWLAALSTKAVLLHEMGRVSEAIEIQRDVVETLEGGSAATPRDEHQYLVALSTLGQMFADVGRVREAVDIQSFVTREFSEVLGADHPDTMASRTNLANAYVESGDTSRAIELLYALADDSARVLGTDNPDTLQRRNNLAVALGASGDLYGAIAQYESLLSTVVTVMGHDHPETMTIRANLAMMRAGVGYIAQAETEFRALLTDQIRVLGSDHPSTISTRGNLASVIGRSGDAVSAVKAYEAVLPEQTRVLGSDHPSTLAMRGSLAMMRGRAGDVRAAVDGLEALLADEARILGPDHPRTHSTGKALTKWRTQLDDGITSD